MSDPESPSSGLRIRASESGCPILGVRFWHSESGSSNLGVRYGESDHRSPNRGVGSPITGVNLGVRSWVSDPGDPISGVQIQNDTLSHLFGVPRWGHLIIIDGSARNWRRGNFEKKTGEGNTKLKKNWSETLHAHGPAAQRMKSIIITDMMWRKAI